MNVTGLILAGGASTRMGSPKALMEYQGETFLARLTRIFLDQCTCVVVVLGHSPELIRATVPACDRVLFVVNENYRQGQLSSLQAGLRAALPGAEAILFTPVDYPAVQPGTPRKLIEAFSPGLAAVVPQSGGRHGHPVLVSAAVAIELAALPLEATARDVMHRYSSRTAYVDAGDPGILRDVDTAADYAELVR